MAKENIVIGGLYAQNYIQAGAPLKDNPRMRFRLSKLFEKVASHRREDAWEFGNLVEAELGLPVLRSGVEGRYFPYEEVANSVEIVDLLHIVTLLYRFSRTNKRYNKIANVRSEIQRIFDECNVGYILDEKGGIHPKFDEEFENVRVTTIRKLNSPEFATERQHVETAERALLLNPLDGKTAIKNIFEAVENLFKQMFPKAPQMNKSNLQNNLKPAIEKLFSGNRNHNTRRSSLKLVEALIDWADGVHEFRHASGTNEPLQPPEELTVLLVSQGLSYLRWLAELKVQTDDIS
ncbi:hypothetical protein [Sneathiella glossodoripedis]|uniref:hypothetical protein n=1 Tax=Sneathiella glossodoripedis TaxID=418853 RepID=UPI00046FC221|nr:hypothetical protein [Sneathiella glossodoripedis]